MTYPSPGGQPWGSGEPAYGPPQHLPALPAAQHGTAAPLFWVNVVLVFLVVGMVTMPLTWVAFLILGPVSAARGVEEHNARLAAIGPAY